MLRRHRQARPTPASTAAEEEQPELPSNGRGAARRRRREPAPQDQALYSCQCGFVFEAAVSTSVGCPHCGGAQAW